MTVEEAYAALGLAPPASAEDVKRAFRRKALESHPDRHQDPRDKAFHQRRFLEVREAYARLRSEGFPDLPEESAVAPDFSPKVAGRSFAPKDPVDAAASEKLGLQVPWSVESIVGWGVGLPVAALVLIYVLKALLGQLSGGP